MLEPDRDVARMNSMIMRVKANMRKSYVMSGHIPAYERLLDSILDMMRMYAKIFNAGIVVATNHQPSKDLLKNYGACAGLALTDSGVSANTLLATADGLSRNMLASGRVGFSGTDDDVMEALSECYGPLVLLPHLGYEPLVVLTIEMMAISTLGLKEDKIVEDGVAWEPHVHTWRECKDCPFAPTPGFVAARWF